MVNEMTREERIQRSLDALKAPEPIDLTLEEWKQVIAEANEESDDDIDYLGV